MMPRRLVVTFLLGLALAGCSPEELAEPLPPTDRFYFPIGIATSRVASGTALLVASSNFDLRYSASDGGTLLSLIDDGAPLEGALSPVSAERISSYAGSVAVADAVTCLNSVALGAGGWTAGAATSGSITGLTKNKDAGRNRVLVVSITAVADASTTGAITCTGSYGAQTGFTQVVDSGTAVSNQVKSCIIVLPEAGVAAASTSALSASIVVEGATLSGARLQAAFYTDVNQSPIVSATASGASATSAVAYSAAMPSLARGVHIVSIGGLAGATQGTLTPDPPGNLFVRQGAAAFTDASLDTFQRWSSARESTSLSYTWGGTSPGAAMVGVALAPAALAMVASRFNDVLYRYTLGSDGSLTCGADCVIDLAGPAKDPFAIGVACGSSSGRHAYVGFLDTPDTARSDGDSAWIAEVDLDAPAAPPRLLEIGDGPVRSMAYDPTGDRLWIAAKSSGERAMLYSVLLSDETWKTGSRPIEAVDGIDLFDFVRGLELRSLAVGTPVAGQPTRLYATARVYDVEAQAANRARPSSDVDGVLLVIDVTEIGGIPAVLSIRSISVGTGIGDVALVQRGAGVRDLVLVTALDGDLLWAWDAEAEAVAWYLGHDSFGLPLVGDRPTALSVVQATDPTAVGASADVYVASFGDHRVSRVSLPIAGLSTKPSAIATIGGLAP